MRKPGALIAIVLLAACGEAEPARVREDDPALAAALAQPLMIDPDLVALNRANSAAAMPPQEGLLPTVDNGPDEIAAARAEALRLVGGPGRMQRAPEGKANSSLAAAGALTAAQRAAGVRDLDPSCSESLTYTALWAARMPAPFPVYPRAAVRGAAGTDTAGCAIRVVDFDTPVPGGEVIDFYYTRARAAGFAARRLYRGGEVQLSGTRGGVTYAVQVERLPSGNSRVSLLTASSRAG